MHMYYAVCTGGFNHASNPCTYKFYTCCKSRTTRITLDSLLRGRMLTVEKYYAQKRPKISKVLELAKLKFTYRKVASSRLVY